MSVTFPGLDQIEDEAVRATLQTYIKIDQKSQELIERINDFLSWVPDALEYLVEAFQTAMRQFIGGLKEFWDLVWQIVGTTTGDPVKILELSDGWKDTVLKHISSIAENLTEDELDTYLEWEGKGAKAYFAMAERQRIEVNKFSSAAGKLSETLHTYGNSVRRFYVALGAAAVTFLAAITSAIIGITCPPTAPVAIVAAASLCAVTVSCMVAALAAEVNLCFELVDTMDALDDSIESAGTEWHESKRGDVIKDPRNWELDD